MVNNSELVTVSKEKADLLNAYFTPIFNDDDTHDIGHEDQTMLDRSRMASVVRQQWPEMAALIRFPTTYKVQNNSELVTVSKEKADLLNAYFTPIFNDDDTHDIGHEDQTMYDRVEKEITNHHRRKFTFNSTTSVKMKSTLLYHNALMKFWNLASLKSYSRSELWYICSFIIFIRRF
ncbi:hypothetical protein C0J52_18555 [Blattella germanica]|nr:hypothetical protein C0J52_18555 [Blattella germanica]